MYTQKLIGHFAKMAVEHNYTLTPLKDVIKVIRVQFNGYGF